VPAPLRLGEQRREWRVLFRKSLQARDVGSEGEIAIAHHQRRRRVDALESDVVAGYQRVAIDFPGRYRRGRGRGRGRGRWR
jgi:hypothetical protein